MKIKIEGKKMKFVFFFGFLLSYVGVSLESSEQLDVQKNEKKYNLSIVAIFKNEAEHLKEWIEYHRLVGVEHFYLYNIGSIDEYKIVLRPYLKDKIVTLINWPDHMDIEEESNLFTWALGTQIPAYENAVKYQAINETKWLVFVDIDEFLVSPNEDKIIEVLEKYDQYPGITLVCEYFDASRLNYFKKRELIIETLELTQKPQINPQIAVEKTIFKPESCLGFEWPPYKCNFKNLQIAAAVSKKELRINHYVNRNGMFYYSKTKYKLDIDNRLLSEEQIKELLAANYEIEDHDRPIYRFIPENEKKIRFEVFLELVNFERAVVFKDEFF